LRIIVLLSSYVVCPIEPPGYNNSINLLTYTLCRGEKQAFNQA